MVYDLHENKNFVKIIAQSGLYSKFLNNDSNLSIDGLLKVLICYLPHSQKDDLAKKFVLEVSNYDPSDPIFVNKIEMLTKLQQILLDSVSESPIFNYQFNSFMNLKTSVKEYLGNTLHKILVKQDPSSEIVFKYFISSLCTKAPVHEILQSVPSEKTLLLYSKTLFKFSNQIAEIENLARNALKAFNTYENNDMETLFYITSVLKNPKDCVNEEQIKLGSFYLPIYYNLEQLPKVPHNEIISRIEIVNLFGEPLIKTIIMLNRLGIHSLMAKASENLSFIRKNDRPIEKKLLEEFLDFTVNSLNFNLNYYAITNFLLQNISFFSKNQILTIFSFFKDKWDETYPNFQSAIGNLLEFSKIDEMLILNESAHTRKNVINLQKNFEITPKNLGLLEAMTKYKLYLPSTINKYLSLSGKIKKEKELSDIISLTLNLLSTVNAQKSFLESIFNILERFKIWHTLSHSDLINFFFIYYSGKDFNFKIPQGLKDNFFQNILKSEIYEEMNQSAKSALRFYKAFKYTTEFEPRVIISNDIDLRQSGPEVTIVPELPMAQFSKYLKMHALFIQNGISTSDECLAALRKYYAQRKKDLSIIKAKSEVIEIVNEASLSKGFSINYAEDFVDQRSHWKIDLYFSMSKFAILFYSESDMFFNEKGEEEDPCLLQKIIEKQLSASQQYVLTPISVLKWNFFNAENKKLFLAPIIKLSKF